MATNREVLLRKLTGLLKRITDADDDYTVTADQRAALMELESLTWNYPTPQQARGRTSSFSHGAKDTMDESEDDDDDESYYMDMVPYDMTERLKEVNRALIEDPTPSECDRAITIRFREVIADYHSPRDDFPSDSDDGYGDSSDLLYDAEDDEREGITPLTSDIKEVLVDQTATFIPHNESLRVAPEDQAKLVDVPKLQLDGEQDDGHFFVDEDLAQAAEISYVLDAKHILKELFCQESSVRDVDSPEIEESIPADSHDPKTEEKIQVKEEVDVANEGSVSFAEVNEKIQLEKVSSSFGDVTTQEETVTAPSVGLCSADNCTDRLDSINLNLPAKSESDFASFDYSDDFEDFQEEPEDVGKERSRIEELIPPSSPKKECPPKVMPDPHCDPLPTIKTPLATGGLLSLQDTQKHASLSNKQDLVPRKVKSSPVERRKKNSSESAKLVLSNTARTSKPKRTCDSTPVIKPALLSSDKLNTIKNDSSRNKNKLSTPASSTSSSPLSSASSSSSPSLSSSVSSHPGSKTRGLSQTSISGPVRPTAHRSSGSVAKRSSSGSGGGSQVVSAHSGPHNSLAVADSCPGLAGRIAPPRRVRKAASASDLHKVTEETDDRRQQNDKVFQAWLRQKNKQAAQNKKQQQKPARRRTATELAERRAQAEEAFQEWLSRKRDQLRLEKKLRGERRRLEDQSRYARTKNECEVAYKEWCHRKREEVRTTARSGGAVPRSQSLERPWMQEKTRKLYSAYLNSR